MVDCMSTAKMPLSAARAALVIALAALLVWATMRMVIGLGVAVPAASSGNHQGAPVVVQQGPAVPAPVEQPGPAPAANSANSLGASATHQVTGSSAQQPSTGCLLTGTNAPAKSYVRGGCPAQ